MAKKTRTSELSIDSNVHPNGNGKRIHMKWKSVPLWYVVLLSIFTLGAGADGSSKWNTLSTIPSFLNKNNGVHDAQEMSIIPYSATTVPSKHFTDNECFSSLRGGAAAVNPFPSG